MLKHALIVDDSKTAALSLSKLLSRQGVSAAHEASAEAALDYLQSEHPDVIFMDHMMPGMDGFEAVKAIRSDPSMARIPIVMYTSRGDDIYVGQARALGAVDLLAKPATEERLVAVLERVARLAGAASAPPKGRPRSSDTVELDVHAVAMAAELQRARQGNRDNVTPHPGRGGAATGSSMEALGRWLLPLLFIVLACWLLFLYWTTAQLAERRERDNQVLTAALQWAMNRDNGYDFGDAPLSDEMIGKLQGLLPRLQRAGFTGTVRLEGHVGAFCLSRVRMDDGSEVAMLPAPESPLNVCDMIGYGASRAASESVGQSAAFERYLAANELTSPGAPIRVEVVAMGSRQPRYDYPTDLEQVTVGDWNAIALTNNRVRLVLVPQKRAPVGANPP